MASSSFGGSGGTTDGGIITYDASVTTSSLGESGLEPGGLDPFQAVDDPRGGPDQDGILPQILRPHGLQPGDHVDEIAVAWRRRQRIAGKGRDDAFLVIADLTRAGGGFFLGAAAFGIGHQPARLLAPIAHLRVSAKA